MAQTGNHGIIVPRNRELLYWLYWIEELGLPQIAALFNVTHKSVERVMRELGIPRRGKGRSRHMRCTEAGCTKPIHKIKHRLNGSYYGRRCKEHWNKHRAQLFANEFKRPEVRERRIREHTRWYYLGAKKIEGEKAWLHESRRLLRANKRLLINPTETPEVLAFRRGVLKPGRTSQI